jgi:hypothetical protein
MKNLIASIVSVIVGTPSTEKAIAGFTKALDVLEAVVAHETKIVEKHDAEIAAKIDQQNAAKERLDRAAKISKRFNKLVA